MFIFITTFIIQFIIAVEMNMMGTLAPFLADYFNISDSLVIRFSFGFSLAGILVPLLGVLADKYGKRKLIRFTLGLFIVGCFMAGFSQSPIAFTISRVLIGLGYYSLSGTILSYVSEFTDYKNRGRASGILRIAFGLATVITPTYASSLIGKTYELSSVYMPIAALGIIAFLLSFKIPETELATDTKLDSSAFKQILSQRKNKMIFVSLFFITTGPTLLLNYLSIHLSNAYALSQAQIGLVYTTIAIGTILGIIVSAVFSDTVGKLKLAKILFAIMVLSVAAILIVDKIELIVLFAALFSFGLDGGWTTYQAYASEINPKNRATFMNIFYMMNALTVTFYSIVGTVIYNTGGFNLTVLIASVFTAIGLVIVSNLSK